MHFDRLRADRGRTGWLLSIGGHNNASSTALCSLQLVARAHMKHRRTLRCLPITLPLLPMTTTVFQRTSPCAESRSKMGLMMTWQNHSLVREHYYTPSLTAGSRATQDVCKNWVQKEEADCEGYTMLYFLANPCNSSAVGPSSALSANSHHSRSRVQKAKGCSTPPPPSQSTNQLDSRFNPNQPFTRI